MFKENSKFFLNIYFKLCLNIYIIYVERSSRKIVSTGKISQPSLLLLESRRDSRLIVNETSLGWNIEWYNYLDESASLCNCTRDKKFIISGTEIVDLCEIVADQKRRERGGRGKVDSEHFQLYKSVPTSRRADFRFHDSTYRSRRSISDRAYGILSSPRLLTALISR